MIDPAIREDPFPYYDELRAQGHVVTSGFALMSAHHEVCLAVLRSPDFGQRRLDLIPPAPHEARRPGGTGTDRATIDAGDRPATAGARKASQGSDTSTSTMLGSGPLRGRGIPALPAASR